MAPINFENDFKEKLDKRTIAPSERAWDTLAERLDTEEKTSGNKSIWWLGIAASVIGILFVALQFFNTEADTIAPEIVDTEDAIEIPETNALKVEEGTSVAVEEVLPEDKIKSEEKRVMAPKQPNSTNGVRVQIAVGNTVPKLKKDEVFQPKNNENISFEVEKAQEVADAMYALSETEQGISDASIDSLLKAAQRDILLSRMKNEDKIAIDAALLLQEVEFELDESFRDRVFKAFKSSYGSIKTAIAQRND